MRISPKLAMSTLALLSLVFLCSPQCFASDVVIDQSTVLAHDIDGNLTITNGATVFAQDITISGDVYMDSLATLYGHGILIEGRLTSIYANRLTLRPSSTMAPVIMGDVEIQSCAGAIRLFDTQFVGQVLVEDNKAFDIIIKNSRFNRDVQLFYNRAHRKISFRNNVVSGNLQDYENTPVTKYVSNQIAGGMANGSLIAIEARGNEGDEELELQLDGETVRNWTTIRKFRQFRYRASEEITLDQIRVAFVNDLFIPNEFDRTLFVNQILLDQSAHQTESTSVFSTGTWLPHDGIQPGYRMSELLHVNGYFQFANPNETDNLIRSFLNESIPEVGWSSFITNDGYDVRLQTQKPNGQNAFNVRFGSAGALSEMVDSQTGEALLAPTYRGEATDRVIQWTIWDIGPGLRHDHPALPPFEDRFNMTQSGTANDRFNDTVEVDIDQAKSQVDVWANVRHQWLALQDPYLTGSICSLTRTSALDGGALLMRRVIRVNHTELLGVPTGFANPYYEAWTPFSDSAFRALALSINAYGFPDESYYDSATIPSYPSWPVAETRGWAMAYDPGNLFFGPNVALVFGRDVGRVFQTDGSITAPRRFVLNSLDFSGGMAILPGFWPGDFPNGSLVDQSFILVPAHGMDATTAEKLDALAARLPAPKVYHPGAHMDAAMKYIDNRLRGLENEPSMATDHLGQVE